MLGGTGGERWERKPACSTVAWMYWDSSQLIPGKTSEKVSRGWVRPCSRRISLARRETEEESGPPLRYEPMGPQLRRRQRTASRKRSRKWLAYSSSVL